MERFTELSSVLDHVWTYVDAASEERSHPFRTPTFATGGLDAPNLRTVVLRDVSKADRVLGFHSDRRAQKVAEIRTHDRAVWHGWDAERSQQLRLIGRATVHTDDAYADEMWSTASPEELKLYLRAQPPGTPLDEPGDGLSEAAHGDLTESDVAPGRTYFSAIRTVIEEIYFLHLDRGGHYRARFRFNPETEAFEGDWIVP